VIATCWISTLLLASDNQVSRGQIHSVRYQLVLLALGEETHASVPTRTCCQRDHCVGNTLHTPTHICSAMPGLHMVLVTTRKKSMRLSAG
jgi:hypothetical protein